jgi:hypothetical protein
MAMDSGRVRNLKENEINLIINYKFSNKLFPKIIKAIMSTIILTLKRRKRAIAFKSPCMGNNPCA